MKVMTLSSDSATVRQDVLGVLKSQDRPLSATQVHYLAGEHPQTRVRETLWTLMDQNRVTVDSEWKFKEVVKDA